MQFILERVSNPDIEPVTLAEAKRHLRVSESVTAEDDDIASLIVVAREWVEDYTGRALIDQTWRLTINQPGFVSGDTVGGYQSSPGYYAGRLLWPDRTGELLLRRAPVLAITSFVSVDDAGAETAVDEDSYELREADSKWPRLLALNGATWGAGNFRITFRAGFAERTGSPQQDATVIPARFKYAIKLLVAHYYENRGDAAAVMPPAVRALLHSERSDLGVA